MTKELDLLAERHDELGTRADNSAWATVVCDMAYWCHGAGALELFDDELSIPLDRYCIRYSIAFQAMRDAARALQAKLAELKARKLRYWPISPQAAGELLRVSVEDIRACKISTTWAAGEDQEDAFERQAEQTRVRRNAYYRKQRAVKRPEAIEQNADTVAKIMAWHEAGMPVRQIAFTLNLAGIRNAKGKPWSKSTVDRIVKSVPKSMHAPKTVQGACMESGTTGPEPVAPPHAFQAVTGPVVQLHPGRQRAELQGTALDFTYSLAA